jgi:cyclopropane-fatty-acyl-phospholipid synthase
MLSLYGLLDKAIRKGRLTVVDAKGITREFGGTEPGPKPRSASRRPRRR